MIRTLCLALVLTVTASATAEPPRYEFQVVKPGDAIVAKERDKRTVFVVSSKAGIGGGEIRLAAGDWPADVTLRFEYVEGLGNGFKTLEDFSLATGRLRVAGSHKQSGALPFYLADAAGQYAKDQPPAGHLRVTFAPKDGALEVTLPTHLLVGA
jgi:hypothetical protein